MQAGIISIGDELLIGQVIDSNSARIAQALGELAIPICRKWTVGDGVTDIAYALQQASSCCDLILITGGLGPTRDDVTKKEMAAFFGVPLVFSEENFAHLQQFFAGRQIRLTEGHKTQCMVPANATLLPNKVGTAMGLWMESGSAIFVAMPGVPDEMNYILRNELMPRLRQRNNGLHFLSHTLCTAAHGETEIAGRIEPLLQDLPDFISIAYLPAISQVRVRLSGMHGDEGMLRSLLDGFIERIRAELKDMIFGEGDTSLSQEIGKIMKARGMTVCTVESCTGGALAAKFTAHAGSSDYFRAGLVTYATESKISLLGIEREVIARHGAVSAEVAEAMVRHGAGVLGADWVIATTGIAGPSGGTEEIPVGTVFIAAGNASHQVSRRLRLGSNRERNIEASCVLALDMLRSEISRA